MTTKTCPKCQTEQSSSAFSKNKSQKDGLQIWCKKCSGVYKKTEKGKEGTKESNKRYYLKGLERAKTFGKIVQTEITTTKPFIDIWLRFDEHYGYYTTDYLTLARYIAWSRQDHVYQICGGDIIENVPSIQQKANMLRTQIKTTIEQAVHLQNTLTDRTLGFLIGNHEGRSYKIDLSLIPIFKNILTEKKIPIMKENNHIYKLVVNNMIYTFVLSHGWGGSQTPDYIIKKMFYDGLIPDETDFVVVGHTHHNQPSIARDKAVIFDNSIMATKRIIGIRPGTFLYNPDYLSHGRETIKGNVVLRLSTQKWNYRIFENLTDLQENDL